MSSLEKPNFSKLEKLSFGDTKFSVLKTHTVVEILVSNPSNLNLIGAARRLPLPKNVNVFDTKVGVLFSAKFVSTNEVKELNDFANFLEHLVDIVAATAVYYEQAAKMEKEFKGMVENVALDMAQWSYDYDEKTSTAYTNGKPTA